MYTSRYTTSIYDVYMAKLYWRVKRNGKWTWVAFEKSNSTVDFESPSGWRYVEGETE